MFCCDFSKKQLLFSIIYSLLFPIPIFLHSKIFSMIALTITLPFLPIGLIGGMAFVSVMKTENVYLVGLFFITLLQVLIVIRSRQSYFEQDISNKIRLNKRIIYYFLFFLIGLFTILLFA